MEFKTRFDLKDKVWYMKDNKPKEVIISSIEIFYVNTNQDKIKYNAYDAFQPGTWLDNTNLFDDMLYASKAELLEKL